MAQHHQGARLAVKLLAEGRVVNRELEVFYPQQRYLNFYLVPLEDNDDRVTCWATPSSSMTRPRAASRRVRSSRAERLNAVTLLAAGVAHELGNPLNSLNIHLQLLERDHQAGATEAYELERAARLGPRGQVPRSRGSTRSSASSWARCGRRTRRARMVGINDVVRESLRFLEPEIKDRDVIVEQELADGLPANSRQPRPAQAGLLQPDQKCRASAQPRRHLCAWPPRVPTRSWRFPSKTTAPASQARTWPTSPSPISRGRKTGTGLGLFIVQRIVQEHGGNLELLSQPGRGTTARILLPLAERRVRLLGTGDDTASIPPKP